MDLGFPAAIRDTQISYDRALGMYTMDLGLYSFQAEQVYYHIGTTERFFNYREVPDRYDFFEFFSGDSFVYEDIIISKSRFYAFSLYNLIDIRGGKRHTFVAEDAVFYDFRILEGHYYAIVFINPSGKLDCITNFSHKDFELRVTRKKLIIRNRIFGTEVISFGYSLNRTGDTFFTKAVSEEDLSNMLSIGDFYLFDDIVGGTDLRRFHAFLELLDSKKLFTFKVGDFTNDTNSPTDSYLSFRYVKTSNPLFPAAKLELLYQPDKSCSFRSGFGSEIRKLLLSSFFRFTFALIIRNDDFRDSFKGLTDVSRSDFIDGIGNYDFRGMDVYRYDPKTIAFFESINSLRYILYTLNQSVAGLESIDDAVEASDPQLLLMKQRNILNTRNVKANIEHFEKKFKDYLALLDTIRNSR